MKKALVAVLTTFMLGVGSLLLVPTTATAANNPYAKTVATKTNVAKVVKKKKKAKVTVKVKAGNKVLTLNQDYYLAKVKQLKKKKWKNVKRVKVNKKGKVVIVKQNKNRPARAIIRIVIKPMDGTVFKQSKVKKRNIRF